MPSRLRALEQDLARTAAQVRRRAAARPAAGLPSLAPPPAAPTPSPGLAAVLPNGAPANGALSLSVATRPPARPARWPRVRAFSTPVNYTVPGIIATVRQDKTMACWAFASLMLASWRANQCLELLPFLDELGRRAGAPTKFRDAYQANTGLRAADAQILIGALDLRQEPAACFTVEWWEQMLRDHGPLFVVADENLTPAFAVHARLMVGIRGNGEPDGTTVDIVDPGTGTRYWESLRTFIAKYEELAPTKWAGVQVLHFPAGTRPGPLSLSASTVPMRRPAKPHRLAGAMNTLPTPPPPALNAWVRLLRYKPPSSVLARLDKLTPDGSLHKIEDAHGPVNLDWYPVRATVPDEATAQRIVDAWRRDVNATIDQRLCFFEPYDNDERTLWLSSSPAGAIIHIDMRSGADWANPDDGSVICGEAANDHWIFSTVWTPDDAGHPVSGNRWFGYVKAEDGSYVFGTRGADRTTSILDDALSGPVFSAAHSLWLTLQQGLARLINSSGGTASIQPASSARYDWAGVQHQYTVP